MGGGVVAVRGHDLLEVAAMDMICVSIAASARIGGALNRVQLLLERLRVFVGTLWRHGVLEERRAKISNGRRCSDSYEVWRVSQQGNSEATSVERRVDCCACVGVHLLRPIGTLLQWGPTETAVTQCACRFQGPR